MSFVVSVCLHRKAVGIIWTCLWWVWCWAFALWWACRGSWPRRCCQSPTWTAWSWNLNAPRLENSPSSWASESSASPASWYLSSWAAQCLWPPYWRSVIFGSDWVRPPKFDQHMMLALNFWDVSSFLMAIIWSFCPQRIPMPVLYGVFLYMGASSLRGIQVLQLLNSYIVLDSFFIQMFVGVAFVILVFFIYCYRIY